MAQAKKITCAKLNVKMSRKEYSRFMPKGCASRHLRLFIA